MQAGDSADSSSPALRPHEAALVAALEANSPAAAFNSYERLLKAGDFPSDVACERLLKGKCDLRIDVHIVYRENTNGPV